MTQFNHTAFSIYQQGTCSEPLTDTFDNNGIYQLNVIAPWNACWTNRQSISNTDNKKQQTELQIRPIQIRSYQHTRTYDTEDQTVETRHMQKKGHLLNTLQWLHVRKLTLQKQRIDDTFTYI